MKPLLLLLALLTGCAAETSDIPNECTSSVVETENGLRLLIECLYPAPECPPECVQLDWTTYECNILHTHQYHCENFEGLCDQ